MAVVVDFHCDVISCELAHEACGVARPRPAAAADSSACEHGHAFGLTPSRSPTAAFPVYLISDTICHFTAISVCRHFSCWTGSEASRFRLFRPPDRACLHGEAFPPACRRLLDWQFNGLLASKDWASSAKAKDRLTNFEVMIQKKRNQLLGSKHMSDC